MNTNLGTTGRLSRRTLLKGRATTAGALGLLGGAGSGSALAAHLDSPTAAGQLSTSSAALATTQLQKLIASDAADDSFGTSVSISADGTTALIGAPYQAYQTGAAYVFGVTGPFITDIDVSPNPANAGTPVEIGATVADPTVGATIARADYEIRDSNDDVVASGSMQAADGAYDEVSEAITATVSGLPAGLYDVCVAGTYSRDTEGPEACVSLEVREPTSGFVTGGGWLKSTPGAYPLNPAASGKGTFNVTAKISPRSSTPRGHVMYRLKACNLAFKSRTLSALTVTDNRAHLSGTGTLNRTSGYRFTLTVTDGDLASPQAPDHVHMRIWNPQNDLIYDNDANTELGRGNISLKTR